MISQTTLIHNLNVTTDALNRCIGAARFIKQSNNTGKNSGYNLNSLIDDLNAVARAMAFLCGEFSAFDSQTATAAPQTAFTFCIRRLDYAEK